jgi:hypothetical protein
MIGVLLLTISLSLGVDRGSNEPVLGPPLPYLGIGVLVIE